MSKILAPRVRLNRVGLVFESLVAVGFVTRPTRGELEAPWFGSSLAPKSIFAPALFNATESFLSLSRVVGVVFESPGEGLSLALRNELIRVICSG